MMKTALNSVRRLGRMGLSVRESSDVFFQHVYQMAALVWKTFSRMHLFLKNVSLSIEQMYVIGIESLGLITVTAVFVGGEAVIQCVYQLNGYVPMRYLGMLVCKALVTELCPVILSFVVASRVATAIAAEIGSMKNTEQLDAMTCLSLDPIRYLIVPKTIACIVMLPVLVIFGELVAFIGSIITAVLFVDVTLYTYLVGLRLFFDSTAMLVGIFKTTVFGAIIAITGSHFGFQAARGAEGIGEATTKSVMTAMVLILVFDFIIAFLVL
jgi:phospholipid/cholesterol/gamma-HCH transport system permease protein